MSATSLTPYHFAAWAPGGAYHVYNRAVHRNRLFVTRSDYFKFREMLQRRVASFAEVFAYACVLNHFHLSVRLFSLAELHYRLGHKRKLGKTERRFLDGEVTVNQLFGHYWAVAFRSYAQSFNLRHRRSGTLLDQTLRRIRTPGDVISRSLIMYIHTNEIKHRIGTSFTDVAERTSFSAYAKPHLAKFITAAPVLERFGGYDAMVGRHGEYARKWGPSLGELVEKEYFGYGRALRAEAPRVPFLDDALLTAERPLV